MCVCVRVGGEGKWEVLWDKGGSLRERKWKSVLAKRNIPSTLSAHVFQLDDHSHAPGVILVHDLTNRRSHDNLRKWLYEVYEGLGLEYFVDKGNTRSKEG